MCKYKSISEKEIEDKIKEKIGEITFFVGIKALFRYFFEILKRVMTIQSYADFRNSQRNELMEKHEINPPLSRDKDK